MCTMMFSIMSDTHIPTRKADKWYPEFPVSGKDGSCKRTQSCLTALVSCCKLLAYQLNLCSRAPLVPPTHKSSECQSRHDMIEAAAHAKRYQAVFLSAQMSVEWNVLLHSGLRSFRDGCDCLFPVANIACFCKQASDESRWMLLPRT